MIFWTKITINLATSMLYYRALCAQPRKARSARWLHCMCVPLSRDSNACALALSTRRPKIGFSRRRIVSSCKKNELLGETKMTQRLLGKKVRRRKSTPRSPCVWGDTSATRFFSEDLRVIYHSCAWTDTFHARQRTTYLMLFLCRIISSFEIFTENLFILPGAD